MQNIKEDFIEFVKTIKKKVHDRWVSYDRKLWTARIFVYGFLLLLVILVGAILFTHFNLFHTDVTSARYMLSAVVQTQSAIVAIVITLTLIAVQLTASAYSPRVIDIFKKNPDMWLLLSCYGVSIFYGFIVLKLVEGAEGGAVSQSAIWSLGPISISFEFCVSLAYWLGAFTFLALFPYMWYIISLLKSENIINRLANEITRDKILEYIKSAKTSGGVEKRLVADPIQPIVDIIHGAIMKYDLETTRVGLKAVTDQALEITDIDPEYLFSWDNVPGNDSEKLLRSLKDDLDIGWAENAEISKSNDGKTISIFKDENFAKIMIDEKEEKATLNISDGRTRNLEVKKGNGKLNIYDPDIDPDNEESISEHFCSHLTRVGRLAISREDDGSTTAVIKNLEYFRKSTAEKGFDRAASQAAESLVTVGRTAVKKGLEGATRYAARPFGEIGKAAAGKGLEDATRQAARSLDELGKAAVGKGLEDATGQAVMSLEVVGKAAAENRLEDATGQAVMSLGAVGEAAADKSLEDATEEAVMSLGAVGRAAAENRLEDATGQAAMSLGAVGEAAAYKSLEDATGQAVKSLGAVGRAAAYKSLEDATGQAVMSLGAVGRAAAENRLEDATGQAVMSLGAVGEAAAYKGLEHATELAVMSLAVVGKAAAGRGKELEGAIEEIAMALSDIGKKAAEQKLEDVITQVALSLLSVGTTAVERKVTEKTTERVAMSLAVLTTSEKKIVENAIPEYKSGKPGSASAQKFLSQYNMQLEKIKRGS